MEINNSELIGITGGIGSGKSVLSRILRIMNYPVYDSDSCAKKLMDQSDEIRTALIERFGTEVYIYDCVNRPFLAKKIFSNKSDLLYVNNIVHPVVRNNFLQWAKKQVAKKIFIESAILFTSGLYNAVNSVVYVDAPIETRIKRAAKRDSVSDEAILSRIKKQKLDDEYAKNHSKYHIMNDDKILLIPQVLDMLKL